MLYYNEMIKLKIQFSSAAIQALLAEIKQVQMYA